VTGKGVIERGTCLWFLRCEGQFCFKGLRVKPAENWFNDGAGMGIHDGSEWQLKVRSWRRRKGGRGFGMGEFWREGGILAEELRALWLVFIDFLSLH